MTVGDVSYVEAKAFFEQQTWPTIPKHLQSNYANAEMMFEELYDYFGGKLTHISDTVADWGQCSRHPF